MAEPGAVAGEVGYYVYAVVPTGTDVPETLRGLDGAEVEYVEHGDVSAAVARIALERPPGRSAELRAHAAVVEALHECGPVVPAQFGSILADAEQVVDGVLAPDHERLADLLEWLRGREQFRLRATYHADQVLAEVVREDPEVAELNRRTRDLPAEAMHPDRVRLGEAVSAALERKRDRDTETVMRLVEPLVVAGVPQTGGGVDHLHSVALLVDRDRVDSVLESLEAVAEGLHERIKLDLVGPMPPYDFAEVDAWV